MLDVTRKENTEPRKVRHWYVMIEDANDGEVRVTRFTDAKLYDGINKNPNECTMYAGMWSVLHKSQDVDKLMRFASILTDDRGREVEDRDMAEKFYVKFLPQGD